MKILITGATSGIGEELAKQLQARGRLLLTGRNNAKLLELKSEMADVEILPCDLSSDITPILDWIDLNKPDWVFNNAGFGLYGNFDTLSDAEIQAMIQVNCTALSAITHRAIKVWKQHGMRGTVMNISSCASLIPFPFGSLYGATKAFVTYLSSTLDLEYESEGIRILASCPGMISTNFINVASRGKENFKKDRMQEMMTIETPKAVRQIIDQTVAGRTIEIVDGKYQFLMFLKKFMPSKVIGRFLECGIKKCLCYNISSVYKEDL